MDYIIYFLGPLILGLVGAKILRQRFTVFLTGLLAFFVAWTICQTIAGVAMAGLHIREESFIFALIVSVSAGVFEESARYIVFSRIGAFKENKNWRSSMMYALGHHGMETVIVGFSLLLTFLVVKYKPDAISDPALLERSKSLLALGLGTRMYDASERLFVGLLIHSCFSGVVMLSLVRANIRYLGLAAAWHFSHNMIGFNLHRLSDHWLVEKAWIAIIIVLYTFLLLQIRRALREMPAVTSARQ